MDANKRQVGGRHYQHALQHWDLAALYGWDYFQARAIAYIMRWREKGGIADLEKAGHFIQKYIEVERARANGTLTQEILMAALRDIAERERAEADAKLRAQAEFHTAQDMMSALAKQEKDGPNYQADDDAEMCMGHHVSCAYLKTLESDGQRHACDCGAVLPGVGVPPAGTAA